MNSYQQECMQGFVLIIWVLMCAVCLKITSTGIDADASKWETSPGYFNSKLDIAIDVG